ncbi:DMT family transporter [Clostridium sp. P21]|uniref:DMT family transporter n=1 Tax=Clostridium muellerianum TaxID=2716538 RepID=A0A7Y0HP14_9CLOT|nr:DMT family transporter [Clostridium muellerianum]NMM63750.1 DMT family transporter [Clostridium muellerianum]
MKTKKLKSNLLLLLAATIWGFAFVAQVVGGKYIGAFTFNAVRFALGSISLIPLILFYNDSEKKHEHFKELKKAFWPGIIVGIFIFLGSSFQQVGIAYTTAGKAAFITGLYIVIVPIFGVFLKQHININNWIGVIVAVIGLYFLCITDKFSISYGDFLQLICAFFFAVQILLIDNFSKKLNILKLAFIQFVTCSMLSLVSALFVEKISMSSILLAAVPILYGGILSCGVAYTLQIVAQKNAEPSQAAIIMSMEAVFGSIGGVLILKESIGIRGAWGCALMLMGMLLAQINIKKKDNSSCDVQRSEVKGEDKSATDF